MNAEILMFFYAHDQKKIVGRIFSFFFLTVQKFFILVLFSSLSTNLGKLSEFKVLQ